MSEIIDGKAVAKRMREGFKQRISELDVKPCLSVILVGEDPASATYVRNKEKGCEEVGIKSLVYRLPESTTQAELLALIDKLSDDDTVHGILVQLPLPEAIDEAAVLEAVPADKDVDGFHALNVGALHSGTKGFVPCTAMGVMELIRSTGVEISGSRAVVIGRSNIVGKPTAALLMRENATVTVCHSRTKDIAKLTSEADILVSAIGKPGFVTKDMVKPGAVVIDVGTTRVDSKLRGDVDFEACKDVAGYITPVPGGVGPMTITMLLYNTLEAAINNG